MLIALVQSLFLGNVSREFAWISIVYADLTTYSAVLNAFVCRLVGVSSLIAQSGGLQI